MNGTVVSSYVSISSVDPNYEIAGSGDFNADGKTDVIWRHGPTGELGVWLMNGTTVSSYVFISTVATEWEVQNN